MNWNPRACHGDSLKGKTFCNRKNKFRKQKCQYAISGEIAGSAVRGATGETINNNFDLTLRNRRPTRRVKVVVDGASHNLSGIKRKTYKTKRTEKDARLYARPRILFHCTGDW